MLHLRMNLVQEDMHSRVTDVSLLSSVIGAMSCIEHHLQDHSTGMALTWCQAPLIPWYNMLSVSLALVGNSCFHGAAQ